MIESANYDESKVGDYTLPNSLICEDGTRVLKVSDWLTKRRPELLEKFANEVYGQAPSNNLEIEFEILGIDEGALEGISVRQEIAIYCGKKAMTLELI